MMARIPSVVTDLPALAELLKHHPVGVPVDRQLLPTEIATALRHVLAGNGRAGFVGACAGITELSYERQSS